MTPEMRSLRARLGAHCCHARGKTNTAPARAAFAARFYEGIPEDLPPAERAADLAAMSLAAAIAPPPVPVPTRRLD